PNQWRQRGPSRHAIKRNPAREHKPTEECCRPWQTSRIAFAPFSAYCVVPHTMLSRVVIRSSALARHRAAPLLAEREAYLEHLESEGMSRHNQRDVSTYLVQVVKRLRLTRLRKMRLE